MYNIGNKIELVHLEQVIKNEKNLKVYVSKIYDILPNNILQIAMPIHEGKIVPLAVDDKYSATFYTSKGLLQCNVLVSSRYKSGNLFFMDVLMLGEAAKVQRREFYRYTCFLDAKLRIVSDEEYETGIHEYGDLPESELPWDDIKILDISGGGAKIVAKSRLDRNEVIKVLFRVTFDNGWETFNLYARVLGSTPYNLNNSVYEIRLEYLKIAMDDRDKIVKFIFDSERRELAKGVAKK